MAVERSVVVPLPAVQWGGLQAFAANLQSGLKQADWRWTVIIPPDAPEVQRRLRESGVEVISASLPRLRRSPLATCKTLSSLSADVSLLATLPRVREASLIQAVGAHHFHGPMLAGKLGKPLVWQIHSSILPSPLRKLVAPMISRRADSVMTNGYKVAEAFWGKKTVDQNNFVFYAPVDSEKYAPDAEKRLAARYELGVKGDEVIVGTIGNRVWQKNHQLLVEAARRLAPVCPKLRFVVLGAPHEAYRREYEETVQKPAERLNREIPGYVRFLDPGQRVDYWIHAVDIFVLTSHAEGVPLALCEAMSAAKPVVSTAVGSIDEIVKQGQTGYLVERGDAPQLAERLNYLAGDAPLRCWMGQAGRQRIIDKFSIRRVVEAHVSAYEAALRSHQQQTG
jgi:glycosyltransferase involved in cell wall biosynthesis